MKIEYLDWDSNFFNLKVGKCLIYNSDNFDTNEFNLLANKDSFDLIYLISHNELLLQDQILGSNLDLVDIQLSMTKNIAVEDSDGENYNFKEHLDAKEIRDVYRIAEQTATVSRFFNDPLVGRKKTIKLYRKWVDNTLNKTYGSGILVEYYNDKIIGICLIRVNNTEKVGLCTLIGVDRNFKGKGIGRKLWRQAFCYLYNNLDIEKCKVNFSLKNTESFNFHLRMGFNITEKVKYIYHYRNNKLIDKK